MVHFRFFAGDNEERRGFYENALFSKNSFICSIFQFYYELTLEKNRNDIFYFTLQQSHLIVARFVRNAFNNNNNNNNNGYF